MSDLAKCYLQMWSTRMLLIEQTWQRAPIARATWVDSRDIRASKKKSMQNIYIYFFIGPRTWYPWGPTYVYGSRCHSLTHSLGERGAGAPFEYFFFWLSETRKFIIFQTFSLFLYHGCLGHLNTFFPSYISDYPSRKKTSAWGKQDHF